VAGEELSRVVVDPVAALWSAHGSMNEKIGSLKSEVAAKASRADLYQFKEAIFDRQQILTEKAIEECDRRSIDRARIAGHETAREIARVVAEELDRRDAERAKAEERVAGFSAKQVGMLIVGSLLMGAALREVVVPVAIKFGSKLLLGF
jgi:response regulator RpfG family c-di-GMP phosphodiesterase